MRSVIREVNIITHLQKLIKGVLNHHIAHLILRKCRERMDDNMYVTEYFHNAITKWYRVRGDIVQILTGPMEVYRKPSEIKDEAKEQ